MVEGKCKICGKKSKLTYEHTPPNKAFNWWKQTVIPGSELIKQIKSDQPPWDVTGLHGKELQRGVGGYNLCESCNSNTGAWYGRAFVDFITQSMQEVTTQKKVNGILKISFQKIQPLRIIKQILCMSLAIGKPDFTELRPLLREFILDKNKKLSPDVMGFYAYVHMGRILRMVGAGGATVFTPKGKRQVSEITAIPLGFVVEENPYIKEKILTNISHFASEFNYDDSVNLEIEFPILPVNIWLPLDYRSKNEIEEQRKLSEN